MLARFLAGGACAVGLLAAISAMPAVANPYDQQVRGSGRSFFATLFGPSIARTIVSYPSNQKPGTIVVSTGQRRLYLVLGNGQALSYAIGVGRDGAAWRGVTQISAKREWPDWTPPSQMLQRRPAAPYGRRYRQPPRRTCHVSRLEPLSYSRLERAGLDRTGGVVGLHPLDQRGRDRSLQPSSHRHARDRAVANTQHRRRRSVVRSPSSVGGARQRCKPLPTRSSR